MNKDIKDILKSFPEFLTTYHLVQLGIFKSSDAAYLARRRGYSPKFLKIGRKIFYPKTTVIEFLESRLVDPSKENDEYI